jgi:hypothetical protein
LLPQVLNSAGNDMITLPPVRWKETCALPGTSPNANAYWHPGAPALRSLVNCRTITGSGNGAVSQFGYDGEFDTPVWPTSIL